ncbi:MAG: DUF4202 domain-containing protein [Gammaproteobacteria bacterium]|nr:DUF4202 domain-containing protein [Gammaproteobacteria bacterium]
MTNKLEQTLSLIDKANESGPKDVLEQGKKVGVETLYARRMLSTLRSFNEQASDSLTLACYAQHVCRWKIARKAYPDGLNGYLKWRTDLAKLHASILAEAMLETGYVEKDIERATCIIQKKKLKTDTESQTLEDVSCLVFLSYYFEAFAEKHADEKVIDIVQKTWAKMSDKGHQAALKLTLAPSLQTLVAKALE